MLHGVDIASFQGPPSQWRAEAGDIDWAAVKFTEGTWYRNPYAGEDWAWLKTQGLCRVAYLFAHPAASAIETAAYFIAAVTRAGLEDGDAVAIDLEQADGRPAAMVAAWAGQVADQLQTVLHRIPVLYTYLSFAWAGNTAGLGRLPLWISDPDSPAGQPQVPAPWTGWALHQNVASPPIDRDLAAYPTHDAMRAALGRIPPPPPVPTVPPVEDDLPNGILLQPGPTPIRSWGEAGGYSQLLLSTTPAVTKASPVRLTLTVEDGHGVYDEDTELAWRSPAVIHFRHRVALSVSVNRTDQGTAPVAWMLK